MEQKLIEFNAIEKLLIDDDKYILENTCDSFKNKGVNITAITNLSNMLKNPENISDMGAKLVDTYPIIICDFKLNKITNSISGFEILRLLREKSSHVFLAMYTAYKPELGFKEGILESLGIYIFVKSAGDDEGFLINLRNKYSEFVANKQFIKERASQVDDKYIAKMFISDKIKMKAIDMLNSINDETIKIYINDKQPITIENLILEIQNETKIGYEYLNMWIDTFAEISKEEN